MPSKIEHFVVLMLENRSFDHMLGFLPHPNPSFEGLKGTESNRATPSSPAIKVSRNAHPVLPAGPGHSHRDVMFQLLNAPPNSHPTPNVPYPVNNQGFAANYQAEGGDGAAIMRCFDPSMVPVLSTLALQYAVCDHWFCSVPGETFPNRHFAHAASSQGAVNISDNKVFQGRTIYEQLSAANVSWGIYHDGIPHLWSYPGLWGDAGRNRFFPIRRLKRHIKRGKLPSYSFIEPNHWFGGDRQGSSQHPGGNKKKPHDFLNGEQLVADIYNWLRSEPEIWEKTLFLVTYDEHGGFYDHVPARQVVPPGDRIYSQPGYQFQFDLSGPRVPAVLVSPWIRQGTLDQTPYDHASIVKTVRELFIPGTAALSDREEASPSVLRNLTLNQARSDAPQLKPLTVATLGTVATALNAHAQPSVDDTPDASEMHAALLELGEQVRRRLPAAQQPLAGAPLASPTEQAPIAAQAAFSNELAERVHELSRDDDDDDDDD